MLSVDPLVEVVSVLVASIDRLADEVKCLREEMERGKY